MVAHKNGEGARALRSESEEAKTTKELVSGEELRIKALLPR
jgi:hypothetical protein